MTYCTLCSNWICTWLKLSLLLWICFLYRHYIRKTCVTSQLRPHISIYSYFMQYLVLLSKYFFLWSFCKLFMAVQQVMHHNIWDQMKVYREQHRAKMIKYSRVREKDLTRCPTLKKSEFLCNFHNRYTSTVVWFMCFDETKIKVHRYFSWSVPMLSHHSIVYKCKCSPKHWSIL